MCDQINPGPGILLYTRIKKSPYYYASRRRGGRDHRSRRLPLHEPADSAQLERYGVGQCKYAFITDEHGGIINDPVLLRLAENHF